MPAHLNRHLVSFLSLLFLLSLFANFIYFLSYSRPEAPTTSSNSTLQFHAYSPPQIKPSPAYTIILLGDSMTAVLGPNNDKLREYLKTTYPDKVFGIFNHAQPSTNLLSVKPLLHDPVGNYPPILNRVFDLIIIESFAYNPLSQYPLNQGLKIQTKALHQAVSTLVATHPNSAIAFLATIAPNRAKFAQGSRDLNQQQRNQWVDERLAYLKNHLRYAQVHHIPIINVYEKSLLNGDGNLAYIDPHDYIHPSPAGVDLISREIASFATQILPR